MPKVPKMSKMPKVDVFYLFYNFKTDYAVGDTLIPLRAGITLYTHRHRLRKLSGKNIRGSRGHIHQNIRSRLDFLDKAGDLA